MDHAQRTRRGLLIVLSSPSGAGKSTIGRKLMEEDPTITMSISATTRQKRAGEVDDVDYHFVSDEEFQRLVDADELAEWAYVFEHRYGSPKEPIKEALRLGRDTLFDIDWQGTQQLEYAFRTDLVRIFILPPSMAELRRRLEDRGTDQPEVIDFRMKRAAAEIGHWAEYDYVLINEDVDQCTKKVQAIVAAERLRRERQPYLLDFVRKLVEKPN
ncbi:guanylate kinase [Sphingomonas astaxanthinifaciens]|uniref:Guanylate kinase n=1 Tax=Sphingomonas astaxanthinifaciens DSM 22298 TaxID=1123267 RepID=A0ABQ5Z2Z7_9SPHN|nr:guanylate kinase [Sphingomonas astaxanthinifaciens]GLR47143.1 guanylate kinase [Sphingomonas astaxanthinifaciens DSM 22298]